MARVVLFALMGFAICSLNVCQSFRGFTRRNLNSENSSSTLFCLRYRHREPQHRPSQTDDTREDVQWCACEAPAELALQGTARLRCLRVSVLDVVGLI